MDITAAVLSAIGAQAPFTDSKPLAVERIRLDRPGPGEVLVRIKAAGLCHSDLLVINGNRPRPMPMALGHEAAGIVEEVGPSTGGAGGPDLAPGDHVVFVFVPSCGHCEPCTEGRPALCEPGAAANGAGTLLSGAHRLHRQDGVQVNHHLGVSGFADYATVSRRSLVKIDPELPLVEAALFGCAVLTGVGAVINTSRMPAGSSAAVIGLGGVGLAALLGAVAAGARTIVAIDLADERLSFARELGTTVTAGLPPPTATMPLTPVTLVAEERTLKGSYIGTAVPNRDIPRYIRLYRRGLLPVDRLLTGTLDLKDINEGFDRLHDGQAIRQVVEL